MPETWPLQDAKARFSEVVKRASSEGPQIVTLRGVETAVVLSIDEYRRLKEQRPSFKDHLLSGPVLDDDIIDIINDRSGYLDREIDL